MTNRMQDLVLGLVLVAVSGIWIWLVTTTIRGGFGGGDIGPRAFPLTFGIMLLVLSALVVLRALFAGPKSPEDAAAPMEQPVEDTGQAGGQTKFLPAFIVLGEIVLYGLMLEKIGFLLATALIIVLIMFVNLRVRSLRLLVGMALGVPAFSWLLFQKLLGIYLAHGSWINLG